MKKLSFQIESLSKRLARVTLRAGRVPGAEAAEAGVRGPGAGVLPTDHPGAARPPLLSQGGELGEPRAELGLMDPPVFERAADVVPQPGDYIYPQFRALSQRMLESYGLDFSTPGVLEASVAMLAGQTVYANHYYWNIEGWLGAVNASVWDAAGANSDGIPGINVELKIDALMNPKIARGLMMTPPAIHSASVTVQFEFDFSHPDLVEQGRFWDLMGEEVEGSIVRLIVTKILGYWELSLVFQGADSKAKQLPPENDDETVDDPAELSAPVMTPAPATTTEVNTVKLTKERKEALGLTAHEGEDVPDDQVMAAVDRLAPLAAAGQVLLTGARTECKRQATLAIVGSGEGELSPAIARMIDQADAETVQQLTVEYAKQAAERLGGGRSSQESTEGQPETGKPKPVADTTLL